MNTIILILAVVALTFVTTEALYVHKISDQDEMVPKTVQMCRISCFQKFINEKSITEDNIDKCSSNSMCFMCWDYCGHLYRESRLVTVSMCSDYVCYSGCKFACFYYTMIHKEAKEDAGTEHTETKMGNSVHHHQQQPVEAKLQTQRT